MPDIFKLRQDEANQELFLQTVRIISNDQLIYTSKQLRVHIYLQMQSQILLTLNHFTFNNTAQILISLLTPDDLRAMLTAIQEQNMHGQLAHLIRARLFVLRMHRVDRTLYFLHYDCIPTLELTVQRCNLLAVHAHPAVLKQSLAEVERLEMNGLEMFGEEYWPIEEAVREPELALPPVRRETVAPHCQTVYQVVLACQKLDQSQPLPNPHPHVNHYFFQLLSSIASQTNLYLSALIDPLEHFAEITYRFMLYRNTVLALHSISPFQKLSSVMQLWKNAMLAHYQQSNKVFLQIAGFQQPTEEYGRFTAEFLREEGYLSDYAEGLIDLSINEDIVMFCGHSKQCFGPIYSHLQALIIGSITNYASTFQLTMENLHELMNEWNGLGLRPTTIRKMLQTIGIGCAILKENNYYCQQDDFIQTCARIHGLLEGPNIVACN